MTAEIIQLEGGRIEEVAALTGALVRAIWESDCESELSDDEGFYTLRWGLIADIGRRLCELGGRDFMLLIAELATGDDDFLYDTLLWCWSDIGDEGAV